MMSVNIDSDAIFPPQLAASLTRLDSVFRILKTCKEVNKNVWHGSISVEEGCVYFGDSINIYFADLYKLEVEHACRIILLMCGMSKLDCETLLSDEAVDDYFKQCKTCMKSSSYTYLPFKKLQNLAGCDTENLEKHVILHIAASNDAEYAKKNMTQMPILKAINDKTQKRLMFSADQCASFTKSVLRCPQAWQLVEAVRTSNLCGESALERLSFLFTECYSVSTAFVQMVSIEDLALGVLCRNIIARANQDKIIATRSHSVSVIYPTEVLHITICFTEITTSSRPRESLLTICCCS